MLEVLMHRRTLLLIVFISCSAFVIAFATNSWLSKSYKLDKDEAILYIGLWNECICTQFNNFGLRSEDWFKTSQAMATLALVGYIAAFLIVVLQVVLPQEWYITYALIGSILVACKLIPISVFGAVLIFVLGFATNGWVSINYKVYDIESSLHIGLWSQCLCGDFPDMKIRDEGWFKATQAMATMALIIYIICLVSSLLLVILSYERYLIFAIIISISLASIFAMISIVILGENTKDGTYRAFDPNFSFGFVCVSLIGAIPVLILSVLTLKKQ
ncbi:DgyrCDS13056 [Dimorphilus gyrociliatus]|uniref:DgyrCDS13056 n=1 Tax=Dimorphilus gyrociliatus TaxID=2664684 RepID=A0A7I8W9I1_9ANNE|nr:DgyrCDS13056 [Dimorphilus gyrociliatus]